MVGLTGTVADMSAEDFVAAIRGGAANRGNPTPGINLNAGAAGEALSKGLIGLITNVGAAATGIISKSGGRISDVASEFSGTLGSLINVVESTNDVFQSLSKVGAGFDGDLGRLRSSAALTRMPLDQFAGMIAQNTHELAGFSGGVNAGAKRFTQLSYAMFDSNLIENFMDLGMTVEESNDFLMKNMAFDRRRARLENMTDQQQVQSALDLAKSMDVMAKITGKSVQDQQDNMTDRMREGATQAKLRLLEKQGVTGASDAYKQAQQALSGSPKVVGDLLADLTQTGVPLTEATKNFAATNSEAYALLQQSAAATRRGDVGTAERLASRAAAATAAYADSQQGLTLATLGGVSDIAKGQADRLEEVGPLIDAMAEHSAKLEREIGRTPTMIETYNDMLSNAVDIQGRQLGGTLPGQELQQLTREGQLGLANIASTFNQELGKAMSSSTVAQGIFEGMQNFINTTGGAVVGGAAAALNIASGQTIDDVATATGDPLLREALETLADPLSTIAEQTTAEATLIDANILNPDGSMNVNVVNDLITASIERGRDANQAEIDAGTTPDQNTLPVDVLRQWFRGPDRALGGPVKQGVAHRVGEQGPETFVAGMDGAIIPNMKAMLNRMPDIAKTMQDEMAQLGGPMSSAMQTASAQMQNTNSLEQKLDILNQTMLQLVSINSTQARTGEKHLRASRYNGNLMTGLGKA